MGADGSIRVYDLKKAEYKFGREEMGRFIEFIIDSQTYIQTMKTPTGEEFEVLSVYSGDNIYSFPFFNQIFYDDLEGPYEEEEVEKYPKAKEIVNYLRDDCELFIWEVWT